ncbi:MAG: DUF371 domain-containing protein [Candidatus Woesearchaeota archaeon]|nr:DUF371 domain-containing protein [Candidatus Woesearchaeota archaeon]
MADSVVFHAYGHWNVLSLHRNTIEFTKHGNLTKRGDCILAVRSDFSLSEIRKFLKKIPKEKRMIIKISGNGFLEEISCKPNPDFSSQEEIVIRKGFFLSERTLGNDADKAAKDIGRAFVKKLKNPEFMIEIELAEEK